MPLPLKQRPSRGQAERGRVGDTRKEWLSSEQRVTMRWRNTVATGAIRTFKNITKGKGNDIM